MKVTVFTRAYNAEAYIRQCVESVLNQTYSDFRYILIDNGSDDNSGSIMREYAESDRRITFISYEQNSLSRWCEALEEFAVGECYTQLDADDWYEPNYLEHMIAIMEEENCDIVATGTAMHLAGTDTISYRKHEKRLIVDKSNFANYFPYYHVYFRTTWAKLIKMDIVKNVPFQTAENTGVVYGGDTIQSFAWLRSAERICIDNSVLHHYRLHQSSSSFKWDSRRVFSDQYLYDDAENFLRAYGNISPQNREFLNRVYANAVNDTLKVLNGAKDMAAEEKLAELEKIAEYRHTGEIFSMEESACKTSRANYIASLLFCAAKLGRDKDNRIKALAEAFLQDCAAVVNVQRARLFLEQQELLTALINNDRSGLVQHLLDYISENKFSKRFDLGAMVADLAQDKPLLQEIRDDKFLKKYGKLYFLVWQEKYSEALELMTDLLLKKEIQNEDFLILYSNLSAVLERSDEFIFSKVRLAIFYFSQKRIEECRDVLKDLEEMGVEDTEEIAGIRQRM